VTYWPDRNSNLKNARKKWQRKKSKKRKGSASWKKIQSGSPITPTNSKMRQRTHPQRAASPDRTHVWNRAIDSQDRVDRQSQFVHDQVDLLCGDDEWRCHDKAVAVLAGHAGFFICKGGRFFLEQVGALTCGQLPETRKLKQRNEWILYFRLGLSGSWPALPSCSLNWPSPLS
jgi:hypothetical protein